MRTESYKRTDIEESWIIIDATGKILTPGIISTDTGIGIVEIGALSVTRDDSSDLYKIGSVSYTHLTLPTILLV